MSDNLFGSWVAGGNSTNGREKGDLAAAAQAVVDRWDTPNWKDVEPTADVINRLRKALTADNAKRGGDEWEDMVHQQECAQAEIDDLRQEIADLKAELEYR